MALSNQRVVSDGTLVLLDLSIEYFSRDEISVYFDDVMDAYPWAWVGVTETQISFSPAVPSTVEVRVQRLTDVSAPRHSFTGGAAFTAQSVDEQFTQVLRVAQETQEGATLTDAFVDINMHGNRIKALGAGVLDTDAVNLGQLQQAVEDADSGLVLSELASTAVGKGAALVGYPTTGETVKAALDKMQKIAPFGTAGLRVVVGEKYDAHYGWGGVTAFPSGKWVHVYRKGTDHGIIDNSELRARDSYDKGATWSNDRLLYQDATHDARPDAPRLMANNRMGFFVNRQDEGSTHFSPLFFKSDDEGVTFSYAVITTNSPYTFQSAGGIMDFPASQGGHDTLGFLSYGYLSAVGLDAFTTTDNGATWNQVYEVAVPAGDIVSISENVGIRVGTQDKWIFFCRASDSGGWRDMMTVFVTTNMLNWGAPLDAGVNLGGNPPGVLYDAETNKVHLLSFGRGGRGIDGFEHHILHVAADADALYNASGSFSTLGLAYGILTPAPSWATGYIAPFRDSGNWYATFTCGEPGSAGGANAVQVLIGDFTPTTAELLKLVQFYIQRQKNVKDIEVIADDNATTTYPLTLENQSLTAKMSLGAYGMSGLLGGADYTVKVDTKWVHKAGDNLTTTMPFQISNSAGSANFQMGAYQAASSIAYEFKFATLNITAPDNTTTTKHVVIRNAAGTASVAAGAYEAVINTAYKLTVTDSLIISTPATLFGGLTAVIPGVVCPVQSMVASSTTPAIATYAAISSSRKHLVFHNTNGEVGSISTSGTATAFTTSSDETWKDFIGEYDPKKAAAIIKADPVREFHWKAERGGGYAVGWGAQTSYAVSKDLAVPGGWFDPISGDSCSATAPGAVYVPWGIDQSKRVPYLWAAVSELMDRLAVAEAKLAALGNN